MDDHNEEYIAFPYFPKLAPVDLELDPDYVQDKARRSPLSSMPHLT
jgi:hypothetical protein